MTVDPKEQGSDVEQLRSALDEAASLPSSAVDAINVLISAGELSVALETLCTQLYEYDVEVSDVQRSRLEDLGLKFGVLVAFLLGDPWSDASDPENL